MARVIDLPRRVAVEPLLAEQNGTMRYVDELYDAADELAHAWMSSPRPLSGGSKAGRTPSAALPTLTGVRVVTGAANAALEQALREASA